MTTEGPGGDEPHGDGSAPSATLRRLRPGFRLRVLGFAAALLVGATGVGLFVQRTVLLERLDRSVNEMLDQEREELQNLAGDGRDPATGEPFGSDVRAIFRTFFDRNVPAADEVYLGFVDGALYAETLADYRLGDQPDLAARWSSLTEGSRGELETPAGPVRYLAVPLQGDEGTGGVFVVANFLANERREIDDDLRVQGAVVAVVLAIALGIAWFTAGRLLRPLREVTDTARTISETDLSRRIPVESDDEVGELARTFNQMLERLDEAFSAQRAFIDDAGHELRTPITVIMGQLELMGDDPDDRAATLAVVDDELGRMARIVEDLLLLAKAEQLDFVQPEPVELRDFTTEVLMKARSLGDRDWRLDACADGVVVLDPQRLTQALLNLARNACEHTDADTVVAIGSELAGDRIRFWVRDHGPGIAPDEQERLFERFARGRQARRRSDGAGLGLAIVRAVAIGHGGDVSVTSAPGLGARFVLDLPATGVVPAPPESGATAAVGSRPVAPPAVVVPAPVATRPAHPAPDALATPDLDPTSPGGTPDPTPTDTHPGSP